MNAKELLVHDCSQRKGAKGVHDRVIYSVRVFVLALQLEGEIVGQVAALVVTAKQVQCFRVPNFEGPEVEHALIGHFVRLGTPRREWALTSILKYPLST